MNRTTAGPLPGPAVSATVAAMSDTAPGTALVTGAKNRIGRAAALAPGPTRAVAVHYRESADAAAKTVADIAAVGGWAAAVRADLADEAEAGGLVAAAARAGRSRRSSTTPRSSNATRWKPPAPTAGAATWR